MGTTSPADRPPVNPNHQLWTVADVARYLRCSVRTIERYVKAGHFPKPRRLSKQHVVWRVAEVRDWLDAVQPT